MAPAQSGTQKSAPMISPFARLTKLLEGVDPGDTPIDMTIGEPRHPMPAFLADILADTNAEFGKYPPIRGTAELRETIGAWLKRRYPPLDGLLEADQHVLPLSGSREGIFSAIFPALARKPDEPRPAVFIPNPFYHTYAGAAEAAQCEPIFLPAPPETGFLPDLSQLSTADLDRAVALFLCSPSNPQGAVADEDYLSQAIALSRRHNILLFADECYAEIYTEAPPPGTLEVAAKTDEGLSHVVSFQSLSKRSNLPGLRSGFAAGDADFIAALGAFRNVVGPQMPLPIQHASTALWKDEAHVEANRALYRAKFDAASRIIGNRFGYQRPPGGFFLWLDMSEHGGGEVATQTLWKLCGVRVVPGGYLARDGAGGANPGADFVRVALVDDLATTEAGLARMVDCLG